MSIPFEAIAARREILKSRAERAQAELKSALDQLAALDVIERHQREEAIQAPSLTLPGVDPNPPAELPAIPFAQAVRDAVQTLKGMEFTVYDIEEALRRTPRPLPEKNLRTRITLELTPLRKRREIVLTHSGVGNAPNRYKLAEQGKGEGAERVSVRVPLVTNLQH